MVVRLANHADIDAVAEMVGAAFARDPAWQFMVPADDAAAREAFARALLLPRVDRGTAWVTDDHTAVAMWDRCSQTPSDPAAHAAAMGAFREAVGEQVWTRVELYDDAVKAEAPSRPYWYLGVLATHPGHQGRGLATAVLAPGLAAAEADGWDCWLETSTAANKTFYARRGFTEAVAVDNPGIPQTWWLRRAATTR